MLPWWYDKICFKSSFTLFYFLQPYRTSSLAAAEPKSIHELDAVLKKYAYPNKEQKDTVLWLVDLMFDFTLKT